MFGGHVYCDAAAGALVTHLLSCIVYELRETKTVEQVKFAALKLGHFLLLFEFP